MSCPYVELLGQPCGFCWRCRGAAPVEAEPPSSDLATVVEVEAVPFQEPDLTPQLELLINPEVPRGLLMVFGRDRERPDMLRPMAVLRPTPELLTRLVAVYAAGGRVCCGARSSIEQLQDLLRKHDTGRPAEPLFERP